MKPHKCFLLFALLNTFMFAGTAQDTLSLSQALSIALENNYGIMIARKYVDIARKNNTPGNAGMLPRLDATTSTSRSKANTYLVRSNGEITDRKNANSTAANAGLQLNWTLFDGFNMFVSKNRLAELEKLSETQLQSMVEGLAAQVITAYFNIVLQQKLAEVYHEALRISSERKNIARIKLDVGSGSELSYLQSAVDMNADSAAYIQQISTLTNSRAELNRLLCRDLATSIIVNTAIPIQVQLVYDDLLDRVINQNPDLNAARVNLNIVSLMKKQAMAAYYPRLGFTSGYNYGKSVADVGLALENRSLGFIIGISASYNIFNGFNTRNNVSMAKIQEENAKTEINQIELDIRASLKQVYNNYQTNLKLVQFEFENLSLAKRNFDIAREKYRLGAISDIELRETQKKMIDAESRYLSAQYLGKAAETELLRLSGQLSQSLN